MDSSKNSRVPTIRNVLFILIGIAMLLLKSRYHGPLAAVVHDHGGNVSVSFAVYFLASRAVSGMLHGADWSARHRLTTAALALMCVEAFELLDGFGLMSNVYDPMDLLANAAGVAVALSIDSVLRSRSSG